MSYLLWEGGGWRVTKETIIENPKNITLADARPIFFAYFVSIYIFEALD